MRNKKALILIVMILIISVFTTGCMKKVKQDIGTKVGSKIGEKILEKALGEDVKIDSKDGISITTADGSMQTGSDLEWPEDKMKPLPKPDANVISIMDMPEHDTATVMLEFFKADGGLDYIEELTKMGYEETMRTDMGDMILYSGVRNDNTSVSITTNLEGGGANLSIVRNSDEAKEHFENSESHEDSYEAIVVDMSDSMPWPIDSMDEIPELKGKINNVTTSKDFVFIEFEGMNKEDILSYIDKIKSLGFNVNASEITSKNSIVYGASNDEEYSISIHWENGQGLLNYIKP